MLEQEGFETLQQMRTLTPSPKIIALSGGGQTGRLEFLQVTDLDDRTGQRYSFRQLLEALVSGKLRW